MKKYAWIGLVGGLVVGIVGFGHYTTRQCTNPNAENWQMHQLAECSIVYNVATSSEANIKESPIVLSGVHIPTFYEIDDVYAADKKLVFYHGKQVTGADAKSFEYVAGEYYVDKTSAFWRGTKVQGSDAESFMLFSDNERYAQDTNNEYYEGRPITRISHATTSRLLVSPYDTEEVTLNREKEIFWWTTEIDYIKSIDIALRDANGNRTWLTVDSIRNNGSFMWTPLASTTALGETYQVLFYGRDEQGSVYKFSPKHTFTVVEEGTPGVVLSVNFSDEKKVRVSPDEIAYVSWASANVQRCYLADGSPQTLIGHMATKFTLVGEARATEHMFVIECMTQEGIPVNDLVVIESVREGDASLEE